MQIRMRQVPSETVEWFGTACRGGELTRTALAREFCPREDRFGRTGRPCLASARKFLPRLAEEAGVRLPEPEATALEPVAVAEDRRRWEAMIETHHPEGWCRPPGGQVRYGSGRLPTAFSVA